MKKAEAMPDDLITLNEAATLRRYAGVSSITQLIKRGHLRVYEKYGRKLVSRAEVKAYKPSKGGRPPKPQEKAEKSVAKKRVRKKDSTRLLKTPS
jgi:hypothetical protein